MPEALAWRVEEACLNGWPALREVVLDGWLLRFANGHTRRANSVNPLAAGTRPLAEKIALAEALYARAGLPTIFRLPSFVDAGLSAALDARGYAPEEDETRVVYRDLAGDPPQDGGAERIEDRPSEEWLEAHARCISSSPAARRGQRDILGALAIPAVFAGVRGDGGGLAALAFGAVHDRILCVNLVVTDAAERRRGLAHRAVASVLSWARERAAAEGACLPVVAANAPAIALYQRLGFTTELYRYHYRRIVTGP